MNIRIYLAIIIIYIFLQNVILAICYSLLFKSRSKDKPKRILVYRTARLGDFIVVIPALAILRKRFPSARIILLTTSSTMKNMQTITQSYSENKITLPWLSLCIPSLVDDAVVLSFEKWHTGISQARRYFKHFRPDISFILPYSGEDGLNSAKKILFLWMAGVRNQLYGWRVYSTTRFMRRVQYSAGMFKNQIWGPLRAVMECPLIPAIEEKDVEFPIKVDVDAEIWKNELWALQGWHGKKVVAVFPGGTFPHKRWPIEKFAKLCRNLNKLDDLVFVLVGANTDREICNKLYAVLGNEMCVNMGGQTTVIQLAALFKHCSLFIGNDSGPAHLASAMDCPCVTLFSAIEYPGNWEPWNSRKAAIRCSVSCEHCFSYTVCPIGTMDCIKNISVEQVMGHCIVKIYGII